jgi:hypothetical protein
MNSAPGIIACPEKVAEFPAGAANILTLLLEARICAQHLQRPEWDFAVEIECLWRAGASNTLLRWLLCQGYVQHGTERNGSSSEERRVRPLTSLMLPQNACFILTPSGEAAQSTSLKLAPFSRADVCDLPSGTPEAVPWVPHWDMERRELRCGSAVVKRFRRPAPNQELILSAFAEEGWPPHIDDPLPVRLEHNAKERLHDTINHLNRNQKQHVLRFRGDGHGKGVCWEVVWENITTWALDRHQMRP